MDGAGFSVTDRVTAIFVRLAAASNVVAVFAFSAAYACSQALFNTADETAHFDYAYQVWHGRLPVFERGLDVQPWFASTPPVQWVAQHPPLYYLFEAPFVGPLVDQGHVVAAGYVGRAASALVACAVVVAVMWAAHAIAPGRRAIWLAAGTATAVSPPVVAVGGTVYNDNLLVFWTALAIGITVRILYAGFTTRRLLALAAVGSGLLLTRSTGAVIFGICGATLGVVALVRSPRDWRLLLRLVGAGLVPIAVSGWFYARNVSLTGNLLGGHFGYLKHRFSRPFGDVAVDPEVWRQWHAIYGGSGEQVGHPSALAVANSNLVASVMVGIPLLVSMAFGLRLLLRRRRLYPEIPIAVLLVAIPVVVVVMQLQYVSVGGGASWRYLLPMVPVISLAVAAAVSLSPRFQPFLLCGWVALAVIPMAGGIGRTLVRPDPHSSGPQYPAAACIALGLGFAAVAVALTTQWLAARTSNAEAA